jgi:hypothetical protein
VLEVAIAVMLEGFEMIVELFASWEISTRLRKPMRRGAQY